MRICFLGDSSSIHFQRIVSYYVHTKDDIMILSTAPVMSDIRGAETVYLSNGKKAVRSGRVKNDRRHTMVSYVKSLIPRSVKASVNRAMRAARLLGKISVCRGRIREFNPDVIYCFRSFPEGLLAAFCHMRPLLLRTAGPDISKLPRYPVYRQVIRWIIRGADIVVTESLSERRLLKNLCGEAVNPEVTIIGIDTALFKPPVSKESARDKYGVARDAFVVISNRYFDGHYNGWLVVKAIQAVIGECPNLVLLYVSPSQMGLNTRTRVEAIAQRSPQMKFIDGPLPHSEMPDYLACGDVYISFSSYDGIPNSLLEAMACGLVPIVGELPQLHEWIEEGQTGYFIPQNDVEKLAHAIKRLYQSPQVLPTMAARCIAKIHEHGSYERCSKRTRSVLRTLTEPRKSVDETGASAPPFDHQSITT